MTGYGIMSSAWDMILQWRSTIKVSIELPVATRHRRDMTENVEGDVKPEQTTTQGMCSLYCHSRHTNQTLRFDPHVLSS